MSQFIKRLYIEGGHVVGVEYGPITVDDLPQVDPATLTPGTWYGPFDVDEWGRIRRAQGATSSEASATPTDPFDPWSGAGAPSPTTVYPFEVRVLFQGAGGEAQTLNITASPFNIVPGTLVGSTGLLGGGTNTSGAYNAPAGGTTLWGLYPGAWYVGFVTAATDDRFSMVSPAGTIENPDNAAWHDYGLINVLADGTVITGDMQAKFGFTVVALVPP